MLRPQRLTPSEIALFLQMIRKPNSVIFSCSKTSQYMLNSIDVNFIFDSASLSARLEDKVLFSSANILQIADVVRRVVFLLFLPCF